MKTIEANIKDELLKTKCKFFHITWYKKDGTIREACVQTNVKKGLNGNGRPWQDKENQLTVYEKLTEKRVVITTDRVIKFQCGNKLMIAPD